MFRFDPLEFIASVARSLVPGECVRVDVLRHSPDLSIVQGCSGEQPWRSACSDLFDHLVGARARERQKGSEELLPF